MTPTVVIDFTPLDTPTRLRGIGRYLQTLAVGLSRLEPEAFAGLQLYALLSVTWSGKPVVTDDFTQVLRHRWIEEPTQADRYRWGYARRTGLWATALRLGASLVHLGDPNATPVGMWLTRCATVVTCHDLIPLKFPSIYLGAKDGFGVIGASIQRRRYRHADHVLAISEATRADLVELVGLRQERVTTVHNGIDLERWSADDPGDDSGRVTSRGLRPGHYLLYAGDTDWRKNVEGMVRGLAVARSQGAELDLAFAGRLEPHKIAAVERAATEAGVGATIRLLGQVPDADLCALYRQALAHLFVSRAEGFGFTVVEAMASGCPVITTHCGSLAEVAGPDAMLVDPDDAESIGRAILRLAEDASHRSKLVKDGLRRARSFSCEAQATGTLELFRRLLS